MCNYKDKFIYLSGGERFSQNKFVLLNTVERFNINTEMWENVEPLNFERQEHSSCALKETIYVLGGFT